MPAPVQPSLPPSFKINHSQPDNPLPNTQLYLAGRYLLPRPRAAHNSHGALWLAAVTASPDTTTIFMTLFTRTAPESNLRMAWSGPIFTPADHPHSWQHYPELTSFFFMPTARGERAFFGFNAPFLGWRGALLADLDASEPVFEYFPCGSSQSKDEHDQLLDSLGRTRLLCEGLAAHNGNKLGPVDDSWTGLITFDSDSGFQKRQDLGANHNTFAVAVGHDRRHSLLYTDQLIVPQAGDSFNLAFYDSWQDRLLQCWRLSGLTQAIWEPQDHTGSIPHILLLRGQSVEHLELDQDVPVVDWTLPNRWEVPIMLEGWLVSRPPRDGVWLASLDGRQRGRIEAGELTQVLLDPQGPSMGDLIVHVMQANSYSSYAMRPVPAWTRLRKQPATWWCVALGAMGLFTVLGFRIHRQERLLRGIVDDNTQAVALMDARGKVLYANRAFDNLHADPATAARLETMFTQLQPESSETLDIGGRWLRWFKRPIEQGRSSLGSVLLGFDETAEREAREGRKFRSLAGMITHELKTPMTPIRLGLDQLRREVELVAPGGTPGLERVMLRMKGELENMNELIRQFMRLAGEGQSDQDLDLRQVLEAALKRINLDQLPHVTLNLRMPDAPVRRRGDAESLALAICGLLTNALEAMERKGLLKVALLAIRNDEGRAFWRLLIEDSGSGIPPELRDKIWEPGFSTKPDGYGYGLFFARKVFRQGGASLRLDPSADGGTLATVEWPTTD